jgi:endogenous inhibitor of DNA gyrase (YacG/DUF329 family)
MKIIKQGKHPDDRLYRGTCSTCGTVVEFSAKEAKWEDARPVGDWVLTCPTCQRSIYGTEVKDQE